MKPIHRNRILALSLPLAALAATGCPTSGGGLNTPEIATQELSNPSSFSLAGAGTDGNSVLYADSRGAISASGNVLSVLFTDPALPIAISPDTAFYDVMDSGSCTLNPLSGTVADAAGDTVATAVSATGCSDQATLEVDLDTSQLQDSAGDNGVDVVAVTFTVDLAPAVTVAVTGNTATDGSGTTESTTGTFKIGTDNSIVVTFSKNIAGGSLGATISGCSATLGASAIVSGSSGTTAYWAISGATASQTCTFSVAGVTDSAGNPDDPNDPKLSMTFTTN